MGHVTVLTPSEPSDTGVDLSGGQGMVEGDSVSRGLTFNWAWLSTCSISAHFHTNPLRWVPFWMFYRSGALSRSARKGPHIPQLSPGVEPVSVMLCTGKTVYLSESF